MHAHLIFAYFFLIFFFLSYQALLSGLFLDNWVELICGSDSGNGGGNNSDTGFPTPFPFPPHPPMDGGDPCVIFGGLNCEGVPPVNPLPR